MHGFRAAMEVQGAPVHPGHVSTGRFEYQYGVAGGAALLDLPDPPTAVFAGSDEMALGLIEAARSRGCASPKT
jgi:LacI family transcriptional regulator